MSLTLVTTPIRQYSGMPLPLIPNEVYLEIFDIIETSDYFDSQELGQTLVDMARVCRLFFNIATSRIFRHVKFYGAQPKSPAHRAADRRSSALSRRIAKSDQAALGVALYVRHCDFSHWVSLDFFASIFFDTHILALRSMKNVVDVRLNRVVIPKTLVQELAALPNLVELKLFLSSFKEDVTREDLLRLTTLKLNSLEWRKYEYCEAVRDVDALAQGLAASTLTSLTSLGPIVLGRDVLASNADIQLNTLITDSPSIFIDYASRLRSLRQLHVASLKTTTTELPLIFPDSAFPLLEVLSCSEELVAVITPRSHLHTLTIDTQVATFEPRSTATISKMSKMIEAIKTSSPKLLHLTLPAAYFMYFPLTQHFPTLQTLKFTSYAGGLTTSNVSEYLRLQRQFDVPTFPGWPVSTTLVNLAFLYDISEGHSPITLDLPKQLELLESRVIPVFPNLMSMNFTDSISWTRCGAEDPWRPHIPAEWRSLIKAELKYADEFEDYKDCFRSLDG